MMTGTIKTLTEKGFGFISRPGEAKDLYFVPRQSGKFPLICADHDWAGMTGDITVK